MNRRSLAISIAISLILNTFFSTISISQEKVFAVNSGEWLKKGIEFHEEGKYKDAIAAYSRIPENDTNYILALFEISLSARLDSQRSLAIETSKRALDIVPNPYEQDLYIQLGSIYDEDEKLDSGMVYLKKAIRRFPNSYQTWHSTAINFYLRKDYDSAYAYFEKAVLMNPYSYNTHYFLGLIAMERGYPVQAMMSFGMSLMISPGSPRASVCINKMFQISNLADVVIENMNTRKEERFFKEDYSEIETYLKSKVALEKKYKIQPRMDEAVFRQFNLICEKLPEKTQFPEDLWASFYAPIYRELFMTKQFGDATTLMVSGLNNDLVKKILKDDMKKIKAVGGLVTERLDKIGYYRSANRLTYKDGPGFIFEGLRLVAKGSYLNDDGKTNQGEWIYYNHEGDVMKVATYNEGKSQGAYRSYYYTGVLASEGNFNNFMLEGEFKQYYDNSLLKSKGTYKSGKRHGQYTEYFKNGSMLMTALYKDGKKEGHSEICFETGGKKFDLDYINDEAEGLVKEYFTNGRLFSTATMKKGKSDGEYVEYNILGGVYEKGMMKAGKKDGLFTTWFRNGAVSSTAMYKDDQRNGVALAYYKNGKERSRVSYEKGQQEGGSIERDEEGRIVMSDDFKKGHLKKISYYNVLTNQLIRENSIDDKAKNVIRIYHKSGHLNKEAVCDRNGQYNGEYKEYYLNGKVRVEKQFKDGNAIGNYKEYFANGSVEVDANYTNNELDGMYTKYFFNEQIAEEGMYEGGKKQGYWYVYDNLGNLLEKNYYMEDLQHGWNNSYLPGGKLEQKAYYDRQLEIRFMEYDTSGKVVTDHQFRPGEINDITMRNALGIKNREAGFARNYLQGPDIFYFPDGNIQSIAFYRNGVSDSMVVRYHTNGKKLRSGRHINGNEEGTWYTYYRSGEVSMIQHYQGGELFGNDSVFSEKGELELVIPYYSDERNGWLESYSPGKELRYKLHYLEGVLVGYTYSLPDGTLIKEIPVENSDRPLSMKSYFRNGNVSFEGAYRNGETEGTRILYYPDKKIFYEASYANGDLHGEEKEYYPNGQLNYARHYIDGEPDGEGHLYHNNGQLKGEMTYVKGYLHGTTKFYDDLGKPLQNITYYWGEILQIQ